VYGEKARVFLYPLSVHEEMGYDPGTLSQSSETESLQPRSSVVKTSFGYIPSIEQNKRDLFITVI
jgi:hypothetical protein